MHVAYTYKTQYRTIERYKHLCLTPFPIDLPVSTILKLRMQDCTGLEESPIDWKAWLGEPTTKRHLPVSTKYIMDHLLFLEEEVLQKIKCRCEEEKLYVEGTGWPSLHAQMADDDDENGKALLDVAADIINLIDAQERTFNPVWVDSSKSDGNAHHSGYSLLWSMEEALKLEVDVGGDRTEEEKVFLSTLPNVSFP